MTQNWHTATDDHWFQPTSVDRFEAQKLWEMRGTRLAVQRYREMVAQSSMADTKPGQTILKDVVPRMTDLVLAAQCEGRNRITSSTGGRPSPWWWYVGLLPADVMSVITCTTALCAQDHTATYTGLMLEVTRRVQLEVEFGAWQSAEKGEQKSADEAGLAYRNMFEALKWATKSIDARAVRSWWRKIAKLRDEPWDKNDRLHFGDKLLGLMIEAGGGWFVLQNVPQVGGKTPKRLLLTDIAKVAIADLHERAETAFPVNSPMICRPLPWRAKRPLETAA